MKKDLIYFLSAFMLIFATACSDEMENVNPASEQNTLQQSTESNARAQSIQGQGLKNLKVTGVLEDGRTFDGMVSITSFAYDQAQGGMMASGELKGVVKPVGGGQAIPVQETFTNVSSALTSGGGSGGISANQAECQILFLDLGPIFLDVLGLQVDLSQIVLDVTAVAGSGNLLGNLLCAVVGLLDGTGLLLNLLDNLGQLNNLLGQINDLLSGLLGG
jgi:hypothetical protein